MTSEALGMLSNVWSLRTGLWTGRDGGGLSLEADW